jgi:RNA polymerase sigma-70 factor (sigma-E family)
VGVRDRVGEDFEGFVTASAARLTQLAILLTRDRPAAEDLLQATLLKLWRSWPKVAAADDVSAYARRVMVNTAISLRRRQWWREITVDHLPEGSVPAGQPIVDDRDWLTRAIRALPPRQQAAVVLRYFYDLDDTAVADVMGCSVSTVRSQMSRALQRLRVSPAIPTAGTAAASAQGRKP